MFGLGVVGFSLILCLYVDSGYLWLCLNVCVLLDFGFQFWGCALCLDLVVLFVVYGFLVVSLFVLW